MLHQLGFNGMAKAFREIEASGEDATLTHPEWLGLRLDREVTCRRDRRLASQTPLMQETVSSLRVRPVLTPPTSCQSSWGRLTLPKPKGTNPPPARHPTPGGIMSEQWARSSRNAWATSSESARYDLAGFARAFEAKLGREMASKIYARENQIHLGEA
jgi:hypothetical protein